MGHAARPRRAPHARLRRLRAYGLSVHAAAPTPPRRPPALADVPARTGSGELQDGQLVSSRSMGIRLIFLCVLAAACSSNTPAPDAPVDAPFDAGCGSPGSPPADHPARKASCTIPNICPLCFSTCNPECASGRATSGSPRITGAASPGSTPVPPDAAAGVSHTSTAYYRRTPVPTRIDSRAALPSPPSHDNRSSPSPFTSLRTNALAPELQ